MIRDFVGTLLIARNILLVGISVLITKISGSWAGLRCIAMELEAKKLEGDSSYVIQ